MIERRQRVPTRSDTILVTTTEYNDNGEDFKTIDPAGKEDRTEFDDAGRRTKTIENYDDGGNYKTRNLTRQSGETGDVSDEAWPRPCASRSPLPTPST